MYAVSAAYIAAMNTAIQRHSFELRFDNFIVTPEDVLRDSMTIQGQCSDSKDLSLGGVYIGVLKFTLLNDHGIRRGTWRGRRMELTFSQLINYDPEEWESIPVGVYTIAEANHTERGIEVTAYDNMSLLDEPYPGMETNGNIYDVMSMICRKSGAVFGMTKEECRSLPNGEAILGIYPENDISTWRDLAHYTAQLVGGYVYAGRDGRIMLGKFGNPTGYEVDATRRLTGSKFSDYVTNYTGVSVVNMADKTTRSVNAAINNGLTINLGSNPLLQYGTDDTLEEMLNNILAEVTGLQFIPFSSSMVGNPAFDLGDVITYTQGTAGEASTCCVMSYVWKFNKTYSVQGFGKNPNLYGAQSRADKAIGGINSQSKTDTIQLITYENAEELNIGDEEEKQIADLRIINIKETFVDFWIEIKARVRLAQEGAPAVVIVRYILDDNLEQYEPVLTFSHDGVYTFNFLRIFILRLILQHKLEIFLEVNGGTIEILPGNLNATATGQGFVGSERFTGELVAEDEYNPINGVNINELTDEAIIEIERPISAGVIEDVYEPIEGVAVAQLTDEVDIKFKAPIYNRVTEDGFERITEDGLDRITE